MEECLKIKGFCTSTRVLHMEISAELMLGKGYNISELEWLIELGLDARVWQEG